MASRKYAMTRLEAGDYLLASNDKSQLWRIRRYWEDGDLETGDGHKIRGWFWEAASMPMPDDMTEIMDAAIDGVLWDLPWQYHDNLLPSRAAALAVMENHGG